MILHRILSTFSIASILSLTVHSSVIAEGNYYIGNFSDLARPTNGYFVYGLKEVKPIKKISPPFHNMKATFMIQCDGNIIDFIVKPVIFDYTDTIHHEDGPDYYGFMDYTFNDGKTEEIPIFKLNENLDKFSILEEEFLDRMLKSKTLTI